jgi:hypothetical protein
MSVTEIIMVRWMHWLTWWPPAIFFISPYHSHIEVTQGFQSGYVDKWVINRRKDACQQFMEQYKTDGNGFLKHIVTGDSSCVYQCQVKMKRERQEWHHSSSGKLKKFHHGGITKGYIWIASHPYWAQSDQNGTDCWSTIVLLQHGSARPHTAHVSSQTIGDIWTVAFSIFAWSYCLWLPNMVCVRYISLDTLHNGDNE